MNGVTGAVRQLIAPPAQASPSNATTGLPAAPSVHRSAANLDVERRRISRLFARAGFGATRDEVDRWAAKGYAAALDHLLEFKPANARLDARTVKGEYPGLSGANFSLDSAKTWWLRRMADTKYPLEEKLTLYWHGHFATANGKVNDVGLMLRQNKLFRDNATGDFRKLCKEVTADPAMLLWLDGGQSSGAHPNENYAREFMELFTLGRDRFTQQDVVEVARAFTGYTVSNGKSRFDKTRHDNGLKTILGNGPARYGPFDVIDLVIDHHPDGPVSQSYLAGRLAAFFHHPRPEPEVVAAMVAAIAPGAAKAVSVKAMLRALFTRPEFMDGEAVTIKAPAELAMGVVRALNLHNQVANMMPMVDSMGQRLFMPPNVAGWAGGAAWANTATTLARYNFAARAASMVPDNSLGKFLGRDNGPSESIEVWMARLGLIEISPSTRDALNSFISQAQGAHESTPMISRGILTLLIASPEYNLR